jgi:hypothetical protein
MNNKPQLVITGFDTKEQVELFVKWYEGHAEQDICISLDARESNTTSMNCNIENTYPLTWQDDVLTMELTMSYKEEQH